MADRGYYFSLLSLSRRMDIYISLRADPETLGIAKNNGGFDSSVPLRSSNAYGSLSTEYEVRSNTMVIDNG